MLVSKPSDFVKSYNYKDTSETNVKRLVDHLNSLSVNERRENLLFFIDQDFDIASNKDWLNLYKEDLKYIWKENSRLLEDIISAETKESILLLEYRLLER